VNTVANTTRSVQRVSGWITDGA